MVISLQNIHVFYKFKVANWSFCDLNVSTFSIKLFITK